MSVQNVDWQVDTCSWDFEITNSMTIWDEYLFEMLVLSYQATQTDIRNSALFNAIVTYSALGQNCHKANTTLYCASRGRRGVTRVWQKTICNAVLSPSMFRIREMTDGAMWWSHRLRTSLTWRLGVNFRVPTPRNKQDPNDKTLRWERRLKKASLCVFTRDGYDNREPETLIRCQENVLIKHWCLSVSGPILIKERG